MATLDGSLSKFPNGVDSFHEVFDLPYGKHDAAVRLTELKNKPSLTNAEQDELLQLANELNQFMITPDHWNRFGSALYAVQTFFNDNVRGFIENKQKVWDSYIKNFTFVGKWVAGKSYKFQNMVTDSKGDLYICRVDHVSVSGATPDKNATQWAKASAKGDKGDIGLNATYKGDWSAATNYVMGDAVTFLNQGITGGVVYIAKRANVGKSPNTSADDWMLYQQLTVGEKEPPGAGVGTHFIEVLD